jgi:hypothetical protein
MCYAVDMKICTVDRCEELQASKSRCRGHYNEYMRVYMLARYHRRRSEWIERLGGKCEICGTTASLEFYHSVASEKEWGIGKILGSGSERKISEEMTKCHLLCKDHHLEKSLKSGDIKTVEHGGGLTGKKNCRCELCAPLKNAYNKEFKKIKRAKEKAIV